MISQAIHLEECGVPRALDWLLASPRAHGNCPLDMEAGVVKYLYRFSHLPDDIERAQYPDVPQVMQVWRSALGTMRLSFTTTDKSITI